MPLRARDVMTPQVRTVSPEESLADLESLLLRERIGGVPVVADGKLVGIVSRSDIVRVLCTERTLAETQVDFYREYEDDPNAPSEVAAREMAEDLEESLRLVARRMAQLRVRDAMIPSVVSVDADAPVQELARTMLAHRLHRLVVLDGERLAGIVTSTDLVRLIADGRLKA